MDTAVDVGDACYKVPRDAGMPMSPLASKDERVYIELSPQPKRHLEVQLSEVGGFESGEARFEPDSWCSSTSSRSVSVDATPDGDIHPSVCRRSPTRHAIALQPASWPRWISIGAQQAALRPRSPKRELAQLGLLRICFRSHSSVQLHSHRPLCPT